MRQVRDELFQRNYQWLAGEDLEPTHARSLSPLAPIWGRRQSQCFFWLGVNEFSTLVHVEVQSLVLGEMCDTSYYIYSIMYGCLLIYTADIYFWRRR